MTMRSIAAGTVVLLLLVGAVGLAAPVEQAVPQGGLPTAEAVLTKYVEATGGAAAYEAVTNRVIHAKMEILGAGVTLAVTNYQARPDSIVTIAEADAIGRIESGVTGGVAWEKSTMRGPVVKEGQERDNALRDAVFDRLVYWRKTLKSAECLGLEAVDGKQAYKVALTPMIGSAQTVYFDRDSGLLVKAESIYEGAAGKFPVVALMGDYRQVDGIKIAYSSTVTLMDQTRVTTVERVEQNAVMPADRFALPAEIKALVKK